MLRELLFALVPAVLLLELFDAPANLLKAACPMAHKERLSLRTAGFAALFLVTLYYFGVSRRAPLDAYDGDGDVAPLSMTQMQPVYGNAHADENSDYSSLFLTQRQCRSTFPELTKEIDDRVRHGPFTFERADNYMGLVQARIKDGKLRIITAYEDVSQQKIQYRTAALHQLHRAITSAPEPLPDTVFSLCVNDFPRNNSWSFARGDSPDMNDWLMPHFSFWSWPQPFIGSFDEAQSKIDRMERSLPWEKKINKAVWRGTLQYNPIGNKGLRAGLLRVTKGKKWADAMELKWNGGEAGNALPIEDFCKYKYIIYTEGVTYSGRLNYHQACTSIIITPPPTFLVHTSHLIRPLFSSSLPLGRPPSRYLTEHSNINRSWPVGYNPGTANTVFVAPDWSDLEATIEYLERNPRVAKSIAERSKRDFVGRGYLSPAAETCYWRSLIRGWNRVAQVDESLWPEEGVRWETFALTGKVIGR